MEHSYRTLKQWGHWLTHPFLGPSVLAAEKQIFSCCLKKQFGKHALLIGVPEQYDLLNASLLPYHTLISPFSCNDKKSLYRVEGDFSELPILTGSIDLVMLPHILEMVDNPRQLLSEACRVIKPEGLIVISGFNPYSLWGLKKLIAPTKNMPWNVNFIHAAKVKKWLKLADFKLETNHSALFVPPINHAGSYKRMHFLESVGKKCFPILGGVYVLSARAKVIPLTPIRLKWKQKLSGIRIPTALPGHIVRRD